MQKYRSARWPKDTAERIKRMIAEDRPWHEIGASFGVSGPTVVNKAKALGVFTPRIRRFTEAEDAAIREGYCTNQDLDSVAASLGRTRGDIYQRILRKFPEILNTVRTPRATKALKKYGREVLELGATADEAAVAMRGRVAAASAAARVAAMQAKAKRRNAVLAAMMDDIKSGKDRNRAIFETRMLGVGLNDIAVCFSITRERVRQICDDVAFKDAMRMTDMAVSSVTESGAA